MQKINIVSKKNKPGVWILNNNQAPGLLCTRTLFFSSILFWSCFFCSRFGRPAFAKRTGSYFPFLCFFIATSHEVLIFMLFKSYKKSKIRTHLAFNFFLNRLDFS
ncbi:MAG: hypothetical protein BGO53_06625 [Sphingobacteriales bacterium 39-19]|nr:MAG: hypothetical protein BGO53_06625 [Sphingobacteriales bacterium 39-19]